VTAGCVISAAALVLLVSYDYSVDDDDGGVNVDVE